MSQEKAQPIRPTDWDHYYRSSSFFSRFTRPLIFAQVIRALEKYSAPKPVLVELGGAGGGIFPLLGQRLKPAAYHIVDTNEVGLNLVRQSAAVGSVVLHLADARSAGIGELADTVFSLGLIEHFDPAGTRELILAHLDLLRPGGIALITFPTPTWVYRASRSISEGLGQWIFHDERPLWVEEIHAAIEGEATLLHQQLIWQTPFTQTMVVLRKRTG